MKKFFFGCAALAALCLLVNVTSADAARTLKLRLGHPMAPGNCVTLGYEKWAELVAEKSGGTIEIAIFPNCQIGSDRVTTEQAQSGTLDLSSSSTPNLGSFLPDFMALDLPYATTPEHQAKLFDALDNGELGQWFRKAVNDIGLEILMFSEYGYRNFTSSTREIKCAADLKGMKIRTTDSPVEVDVAKALETNPAPVAWGETYTALQQGTVDGEGNTFSLLDAAKHSEVLKFAINSEHNYSMHILVMNKAKFDSLTDEQKKILKDAAAEATVYERTIAPELEKKATESFLEHGIKIHYLTPEEKAEFYKLTQPVRDKYSKGLPEELLKLVADTQK